MGLLLLVLLIIGCLIIGCLMVCYRTRIAAEDREAERQWVREEKAWLADLRESPQP